MGNHDNTKSKTSGYGHFAAMTSTVIVVCLTHLNPHTDEHVDGALERRGDSDRHR